MDRINVKNLARFKRKSVENFFVKNPRKLLVSLEDKKKFADFLF